MDDLRPELSVYGQSQISSPNIDALAENGIPAEGKWLTSTFCN
jgi:arylsulfatase A-like enzyme